MNNQTFPKQQYTSIETAELDRLSARIAELEARFAMKRLLRAQSGPVPDYTGEGSAWVPPVEAQAVVVPELTAADLFGSIGQIPAKATWGEIVGVINGFVQNRLRTIPADRELGEGQVAVDREELKLYREWENDARAAPDGSVWPDEASILKKLDALRANQGGVAT